MNTKEKINYWSDYVCKYLSYLNNSFIKIEREFKTKVYYEPTKELNHWIWFLFQMKWQWMIKIFISGYFLMLIGSKEKKRPIIWEDVGSAFNYLIQYLKWLDSQ